MKTVCPLCVNNQTFSAVHGIDRRNYIRCLRCQLIFVDPVNRPTRAQEKARYLTHNNGIQHEGYVTFLNQAIEPALPYLNTGMHGLDFGCGPTPTLSLLLKQRDINCDDYDPFFFPGRPNKTYDFIFATECFEHFFNPRKEMCSIQSLLNARGFLIVMTELWQSEKAFSNWHYANDSTHVCFYHKHTIGYIQKHFGFRQLTTDNTRVIIMQKTD